MTSPIGRPSFHPLRMALISHRGPRSWGIGVLYLASAGITYRAYTHPDIALSWVLAPLAVGLLIGTRRARAWATAVYLAWPVVLSSTGFIGLGHNPVLVGLGAVLVLTALCTVTARVGIAGATGLLLLIPVFPASPLLPLLTLLPLSALFGDSPHPVLGVGVLCALVICGELVGFIARKQAARSGSRIPMVRGFLMGVLILSGLMAVTAPPSNTPADPSGATPPGWHVVRIPPFITDPGRWLYMRDHLPAGHTVLLGENVFDAEDPPAIDLWCRTVRERSLVLYVGVREPGRHPRRSAVWRLDSGSCAAQQRSSGHTPTFPAVVRARLGVPGHTGTWGLMPSDAPSPSPDPPSRTHPDALHLSPSHVLICLEAFLPWAWITGPLAHLWDGSPAPSPDQPILILSNDRAFGSWRPAVQILRRKVAAAMARLTARSGYPPRPVLHAETGTSFIAFDAPPTEVQ